uniref:Uncharacterized protein n=1 Tax=Nothoprocta perdicaria TaxID=30464 RepID=A0A8C6ZZT6_NOTPE
MSYSTGCKDITQSWLLPSLREDMRLPQPATSWPYVGCPPSTDLGGCVVQVRGVHSGAQRHRARLGFLQVFLHLHQAQLEVHPPALLLFALFFYLLQPLLEALIWKGRNNSPLLAARSKEGELRGESWHDCLPAQCRKDFTGVRSRYTLSWSPSDLFSLLGTSCKKEKVEGACCIQRYELSLI